MANDRGAPPEAARRSQIAMKESLKINNGCGWYGTIDEFLAETPATLQKDFSALIHDLNLPLGDGQIRAWADSIRVLKRECHELVEQRPGVRHWGLVFEYELPRERGRRPDVVLLTGPAAHVIEFKGRQYAEQSDVDQVDAYARDLREYHAGSHELDVRPILALDDASLPAQDVDNVTILGGKTLASYLQSVPDNHDSRARKPSRLGEACSRRAALGGVVHRQFDAARFIRSLCQTRS